jgi:hypothetical protein
VKAPTSLFAAGAAGLRPNRSRPLHPPHRTGQRHAGQLQAGQRVLDRLHVGAPLPVQQDESSPTGEDSPPKDDRHKFRLMAEYRPVVAELIEDGVVARGGLRYAYVSDTLCAFIAVTRWRYAFWRQAGLHVLASRRFAWNRSPQTAQTHSRGQGGPTRRR